MAQTIYVKVTESPWQHAADWFRTAEGLSIEGCYVVTLPSNVSDDKITDALDAFLGQYDLPDGWVSRPFTRAL